MQSLNTGQLVQLISSMRRQQETTVPDCTNSRRHGVGGHPQVVCGPAWVDDHPNAQSTGDSGNETAPPVNALIHEHLDARQGNGAKEECGDASNHTGWRVGKEGSNLCKQSTVKMSRFDTIRLQSLPSAHYRRAGLDRKGNGQCSRKLLAATFDSSMCVNSNLTFPRTPKMKSQKAVATPAIREAQSVKAIIPLFWANTLTGGEVAQLARKQLKPAKQHLKA